MPLDRESIASQCMDIHRNPRISKWKSKDIQMEIQGYPNGNPRISIWKSNDFQMDIHKSMDI